MTDCPVVCPRVKIDDKASIVPLVAGLRRDVLALISEGMGLVWESYKLDPYVQKLSEVVVSFQEKVRLTLFWSPLGATL